MIALKKVVLVKNAKMGQRVSYYDLDCYVVARGRNSTVRAIHQQPDQTVGYIEFYFRFFFLLYSEDV